MKNKSSIGILFIIFILLFSRLVFAHPGSLDKNGGHWNRSTGTYHYHRGENKNSGSTTSVTATNPPVVTPEPTAHSTPIATENKSVNDIAGTPAPKIVFVNKPGILGTLQNALEEYTLILTPVIIIIVALLIYRITYNLIKRIKKPKSTAKYINKGIQKYYAHVRKEGSNKKYSLEAEVNIVKTSLFTFTYSQGERNCTMITAYELNRIYWGNGGYISFVSTDEGFKVPCLTLNKEVKCVSNKGEVYYVTLTDELVTESLAVFDKIKAEKEKLEKFRKFESNKTLTEKENLEQLRNEVYKDINNLLENVEVDYNFFSALIADYRMYLNYKVVDELKNKPYPAPTAAATVKEYSDKLRDCETALKELQYKIEVYKSAYPELEKLDKMSAYEISSLIKHKE